MFKSIIHSKDDVKQSVSMITKPYIQEQFSVTKSWSPANYDRPKRQPRSTEAEETQEPATSQHGYVNREAT